MPQSSPGRYATHNFAKNVYDVKLVDQGGAAGAGILTRQDTDTWLVTGHRGRVSLEYTLFANGGDGTYSGVDDRKLHLNMPATFLYGEQLNDRPVLLRLPPDQRPEWTAATQLVPVGNRSFAAPNYYYFYDSPVMVGDIMRAEFTVGPEEKAIEVAMIHDGTRAEFDDYVEMVQKTVLTQQKVYGELPDFDYGRYTFLCAYNAYIGGDGMEHRNSTVCSSPQSLAEAADDLIGTVSHEFFHCWNVERIRPASLEPFDFDHANMSGELWFAEGFTSYYDDLALVRAGLMTPGAYAENLQGLFDYVINSPGRAHRNPIEMSQQAPFVDAATANDPNNFRNTFVSYYPYGEVLALALDLQLREREHTLDELMQLVWQRYGKPEIPYHIRDLQLALGSLVGDQAWAADWFDRHIHGSELPDFAPLLSPYGFTVERRSADTVALDGLGLYFDDEGKAGGRVRGTVLENSPLYAAGVDRGSRLLTIDGRDLTGSDQVRELLAGLNPGQSYAITFEQLGRMKTGTFVATASPDWRVTADTDPKKKVAKRRAGWLE